MPEGGNPLYSTLIWMAVLFGLMYFMMIRPQQKEQRARAEMMRNLKPGDKIVTVGGLIGVITKVEDSTLKVRVAEKVEVDLYSTGVQRVLAD